MRYSHALGASLVCVAVFGTAPAGQERSPGGTVTANRETARSTCEGLRKVHASFPDFAAFKGVFHSRTEKIEQFESRLSFPRALACFVDHDLGTTRWGYSCFYSFRKADCEVEFNRLRDEISACFKVPGRPTDMPGPTPPTIARAFSVSTRKKTITLTQHREGECRVALMAYVAFSSD